MKTASPVDAARIELLPDGVSFERLQQFLDRG
jgi:hypothetical protein